MPLPRNPKPSVVHEDGSLWEASWEVDKYGNDLWAIGLFDKDREYVFRQLEPNPDHYEPPWWAFWKKATPRYRRTGKVWIGGGPISKAGFTALWWKG